MGVQGLWDLLAPVGRRVSVETLAGKKLAIDASIWMIQFMKAMRDEKGEMVRNAHILGFFRRICKLLYLRTKPVFVFDGGTPALKRRTVVARRRQRENAQAKIRKTAEKLLLNQLKAMRLKELAADLEKQRRDNEIKGKKPIVHESVDVNKQHTEKRSDKAGIGYTQEELDEMVAASIAADEDESFAVDALTSGVRVSDDESFGDGDEDDEEEIILPEMHGKVDPAILASLPPSMQLDLLVQMRERLMAENRQKYQKVKKAPERFSELQIQSYLKTVAFRREIDAVQKSAAGRGIGGVQTSRIASEANREFIFSSSFTGDKRVLSSVGQDKVGADQSQPSTSNRPSSSVNKVETSNKSTSAAEINVSEPAKAFHDDVETYVDERGRTRLSRVRALGIRMTRDLQRNLDLIKEIDQEKELNDKQINAIDARKNVIDIPDIPFERKQHEDYGDEEIFEADDDVADASEEHATVTGNNAIEISFEHTGKQENEDDDFFARLVAGDNSASAKQSSSSSSDCEWEEGVVEGVDKENIPKEPTNDEEEIEWEDGSQDMQLKPQFRQDENESRNKISKGVLQEESDIQEAIRRSLEDSSIYVNEPREDHHIPERLTHVTSENDDVLRVVEKTVETEDATVDESQPFIGFINKSSNNNVEANSAPIAEVKPDDRSDSKSQFSNQQGCSSGVFSEEGLVASDSMHAEMGSSLGGEHEDRVNCGESGLGSTMKDLESSDREEVSLDSSNLKVKSSFTELFSERSIDHMSADQNLINDDFNNLADVPKASQVFNAEVNTHVEFCVEEEETAQGSPLIEVSQHDITEEHLNEEMMFLDKEREELSSKQKKLERNAESVSSEMFAECQELLQMFGLPYIIAPMEAEAQCAFMELSNLVDGVVTDDSDAFLFGARNVYKNIFDDRKYVETYLMKDIEDELGLDREKLIHMALLLGSDYTEGISGIGIVNAIEVVNAFPGKDGLREFREWIESPDPTILGIADLSGGKNSRKKVPKRGENPSDANATEGVDDEERIRQIFMDKHRNVSKNWHIPSSFPSDMVISAYDSPQVDRSTEPFSWGKPDLFVLRKLCWEKFGWNNTKADELLLPVLKEYNKHETQLRLEAFYTFNERFAKIRSKRIKKAVKGISGNKVSELTEDKILPQSGYVRKRKSKHSASDETIVDAEFAGPSDRTTTERQVKLRLSEKKNSQRNAVQSTCADDEVIATRESDVRRRRGRGRGQPSGTRKRKKNAPNPESESSHDDSDTDEEVRFNISEGSSLVRRSERTRKTINYTVSDESDDQRDEHEDRLDREETTDMALVCDTVDGCAQGNSKKELNEDSRGICSVDETKKVSMTVSEINNDETNGGVDLDQSSKSYLQFGGGFCEDDDDHDDEHAMSPVDNEIFTEESDFKSVAEENREGVRSFITEKSFDVTVKDKVPNDDDHSTNDSADETGTRFRGSLRAMPGLRRKKPRT